MAISRPENGLDLSYSQIVNAVYQLCEQGAISSAVHLQINPLAMAIAEAQNDEADEVRPEIETPQSSGRFDRLDWVNPVPEVADEWMLRIRHHEDLVVAVVRVEDQRCADHVDEESSPKETSQTCRISILRARTGNKRESETGHGETAKAPDRTALVLDGKRYFQGFGVQADSRISFKLPRGFKRFEAGFKSC